MTKIRSVAMPEDLDVRMIKQVKKLDIPLTEFIRQALEVYLELDPLLLKKAGQLAGALGLSTIDTISHLAMGRLAELKARRKVWGPSHELMQEFVSLDKETLQGRALFDFLTRMYLKREEQRLADWKAAHPEFDQQ